MIYCTVTLTTLLTLKNRRFVLKKENMSALDFAAAVIQAGPVNPLQLQKILLFSQGYSLVVFGEPLFPETFRIDKYGATEHTSFNLYHGECRDDHDPITCSTCEIIEPKGQFSPVEPDKYALIATVRSLCIPKSNQTLSDEVLPHGLMIMSWIAHSTEKSRIIPNDELRRDFCEPSHQRMRAFNTLAAAVHFRCTEILYLHEDVVNSLKLKVFTAAKDIVLSAIDTTLSESMWYELRLQLHVLTTSINIVDAQALWQTMSIISARRSSSATSFLW